MTPRLMTVLHDPDNGSYGDCFRTMLASILDLPVADVPHFLHDNCDAAEFHRRVNEFLGGFGYCLFSTNYFDVKEWMDRTGIKGDIYHGLSGPSPRYVDTLHSVVACNGVFVHDPHPSQDGVLMDDPSKLGFDFLVRL